MNKGYKKLEMTPICSLVFDTHNIHKHVFYQCKLSWFWGRNNMGALLEKRKIRRLFPLDKMGRHCFKKNYLFFPKLGLPGKF